MSEPKKLTRDVDAKVLGGVCAGLGEYLDIDKTVVRVAFALITLLTAFVPGVLAYVVMWAIIPPRTPAPINLPRQG